MLAIKDRLYLIEDDFVHALSLGEEALAAFEERWEALLQDVDKVAGSATGLDVECATLVHATATRLATLAETSAELFAKCDDSTSQLADELDGMLSEITIEEHRPPSPVSSSCSIDVPSPSEGELYGRKRRRNKDDHVNSRERKTKRPRAPSPSPTRTHTSRSTPSRTVTTPRQDCPDSPEQCTRPTKRKRCLSDVSTQPSTSCKRNYVGPRLHAVSDTFLPACPPTPRLATTSPSYSDEFSDACDYTWPAMDPFSATVPFDIQPMVGFTDQWSSNSVDRFVSELDECNTLSSSLLGSNKHLIPAPSIGHVLATTLGWPLSSLCLSPNVNPSTPSSSSTPSPLSTPSFPASHISVAGFDLVPFLPLDPYLSDEFFDAGPLQYPSTLFNDPKDAATSHLACGDVPDPLLPLFEPMGWISAETSSWDPTPTSILVNSLDAVEGDRT